MRMEDDRDDYPEDWEGDEDAAEVVARIGMPWDAGLVELTRGRSGASGEMPEFFTSLRVTPSRLLSV